VTELTEAGDETEPGRNLSQAKTDTRYDRGSFPFWGSCDPETRPELAPLLPGGILDFGFWGDFQGISGAKKHFLPLKSPCSPLRMI
jgi:hypothetical protein